MSNLPDCCYEYRYEAPEAEVIDVCSDCDCDIHIGEEYYDINGLILCEDCLNHYKKEA